MLRAFSASYTGVNILVYCSMRFPRLSQLVTSRKVRVLFMPFLASARGTCSHIHIYTRTHTVRGRYFIIVTNDIKGLPHMRGVSVRCTRSNMFAPYSFTFPASKGQTRTAPGARVVLISSISLSLLDTLRACNDMHGLGSHEGSICRIGLGGWGDSIVPLG